MKDEFSQYRTGEAWKYGRTIKKLATLYYEQEVIDPDNEGPTGGHPGRDLLLGDEKI